MKIEILIGPDAQRLIEDAEFRLETSRRDLNEARWSGTWTYRFKGREGSGEGVSQTHFQYKKGDETSELAISTSRLSSAGRMNFPISVSGEKRTMEIAGSHLHPVAVLSGIPIALTGCREEENG